MTTRIAFIAGPARDGAHPITFLAIGGDPVEGSAATHTGGTEASAARNRGTVEPQVGAKVLVHRFGPRGEWSFRHDG